MTGRTQVVKCGGSVSSTAEINTSIIHGSGIGPMLYFVMESDLCTLSAMNVLVKYADDTDLLVPSDSDLDLSTKFDNIKQWAIKNRMVVNILKTKEVVLGTLIPDWMSVWLNWWVWSKLSLPNCWAFFYVKRFQCVSKPFHFLLLSMGSVIFETRSLLVTLSGQYNTFTILRS